MPFSVNEYDQGAVIELQGKFLGSLDGPAFKETLEDLKAAGRTHVVIDLAKADFMDSSGMGTLISGLTTMRRAGGDMRLASIEKRIKNLFLITRLLGPVFQDYPSAEAARKSFESDPPEASADPEG